MTANNVTVSGFTIRNSGSYYPYSGIHVYGSSGNNISHNIVTSNNNGIRLEYSSNNTLTSNSVSNSQYGIYLYGSDNNTLTDNSASNNQYNFGVWFDFNNYVDTSNRVDGKPIYYLIGADNAVIDAQTNAGTVILINCNNITIRDLTLTKNFRGIFLQNTTNSKIENVTASNNHIGIQLWDSTNNTLMGNTVSLNNDDGICFWKSNNNTLIDNIVSSNHVNGIVLLRTSNSTTFASNTVSNNRNGIWLIDSSHNTLTSNTISNNVIGVYLSKLDYESENNIIFHNNFIDNDQQVEFESHYYSSNTWDNGYPSGGNYWSDYTEVDANMDGIGDTSYEVDSNNIDNYPLIGMFSDFPVSWEEETYHVTTVCNSTISAFEFDQVNMIISFNVTGEEGIGFCRVCIPRDLMEPPYTVTVDGHSPEYVNYTLHDNGTHRWIYFTYLHSTHEVEIIPEFPTWTSMLLLLIVLTVAIAIHKRRLLKTPIH